MLPSVNSDPTLRSVLRVTKALADAQRVRILLLLRGGELCVCQIVEVLGRAPSTVSKHLSILVAAGLAAARKEGRWMCYRLTAEAASAFARPTLARLVERLKKDAIVARDAKKLQPVAAAGLEAICRSRCSGGRGKAARR